MLGSTRRRCHAFSGSGTGESPPQTPFESYLPGDLLLFGQRHVFNQQVGNPFAVFTGSFRIFPQLLEIRGKRE